MALFMPAAKADVGSLDNALVEFVSRFVKDRPCQDRLRSLQGLGVLSVDDLETLTEDHLRHEARAVVCET